MNNPDAHTVDEPIRNHPVVSHDQWIAARKELMEKEKELTRLSDEVNIARRALPWERVRENYVFDSNEGKVTLSDLFGSKRQVIVYHFMLAPGWDEGCVGCSHMGDQLDGPRPHIEQADVNLYCVSRAPLDEINAFKKRMGWKFNWVSSGGTSFNEDYGVTFSKEEQEAGQPYYNFDKPPTYDELPGISVFYKDEEGNVFHTYSAYARGLDNLMGTHHFLDLTPKGRCEDGPPGSGWLRHHDKYDTAETGCGCGAKS